MKLSERMGIKNLSAMKLNYLIVSLEDTASLGIPILFTEEGLESFKEHLAQWIIENLDSNKAELIQEEYWIIQHMYCPASNVSFYLRGFSKKAVKHLTEMEFISERSPGYYLLTPLGFAWAYSRVGAKSLPPLRVGTYVLNEGNQISVIHKTTMGPDNEYIYTIYDGMVYRDIHSRTRVKEIVDLTSDEWELIRRLKSYPNYVRYMCKSVSTYKSRLEHMNFVDVLQLKEKEDGVINLLKISLTDLGEHYYNVRTKWEEYNDAFDNM